MRRLERTGVAMAMAAAVGVITIGACSKQVSGTAEVNQTDLAAYSTEISASRAAAAQRAVGGACTALRTANTSSVRAFNDYINASNDRGRNDPDANAKADVAVTTLHDNAHNVEVTVTNEVSTDIATPLRAYRDDTNGLADTLAQRAPTDTLNTAIDKFNATKDVALAACQGH
ncbi:hypothetical protein [Nocardia australiensis]|uniref:hypothetical protein n=1 Tax=Nocardia australiensis TaxID=2887191 RepID=UPI001D14BCA4|nr:hypothetical protein [Nocardia australiensis]